MKYKWSDISLNIAKNTSGIDRAIYFKIEKGMAGIANAPFYLDEPWRSANLAFWEMKRILLAVHPHPVRS